MKLSQMAIDPRKPRKFNPVKVKAYTVLVDRLSDRLMTRRFSTKSTVCTPLVPYGCQSPASPCSLVYDPCLILLLSAQRTAFLPGVTLEGLKTRSMEDMTARQDHLTEVRNDRIFQRISEVH